ncbi:MAG: aminotransferase class I/II-fold pyridoxal phosphate-dependent enzyme [Deltaproteobacteria bacterium]|nr:aminotransferase class I/II-fold pyridoxal phosphate-dependent enzyme [Deltaproteobacteria bacterium]
MAERSIPISFPSSGEPRNAPVAEPIELSTTFCFPDSMSIVDFAEGRLAGAHEYRRYSSPNIDAVEKRLAKLEGAEAALVFPSGMCAEAMTFIGLLKKIKGPCEVLIAQDCYRRTRELLDNEIPHPGITRVVVPNDELNNIEKYITPNTKIAFFESPTNPYLRVIDFEYLAGLGKMFGFTTIVDSTFGSPSNQLPLEAGIDLVIHSATKYLGGHNDVLMGLLAGKSEIVDSIRLSRGTWGTLPSPQEAWLLSRSLETFFPRMRDQNASGMEVARFLESHPFVERVWYPGLPSHPDHEVASRQMSGFGGVISFEYNGDWRQTADFVDRVVSSGIASLGASFGACRGLIEQPMVMSYWNYTPEQRETIGIKDNLVRYSVGTECGPQEIIPVLEQALKV